MARLAKLLTTTGNPTLNRDITPCRCRHLRGDHHLHLAPLLWVAWVLELSMMQPPHAGSSLWMTVAAKPLLPTAMYRANYLALVSLPCRHPQVSTSHRAP